MEKKAKAMICLKDHAVSFLQLVSSGSIDEAYERYVDQGFCHHNPYFRGDADSLKAAMKENAAETPNKTLVVKHAIEEGDIVAVHSHIKQNPEDHGAAVVHIFRFHADRIVELWDLGQPIPENSPNENGMF
ncbi:nuclear transport factor 2 family protein [Neobacillus sp. 19]|uniref:nuclear transport factor 2 family protein n=1 Tax=Neobacillus sp. 19 TaxID=3394458 RepID=UPI003BF6EE23